MAFYSGKEGSISVRTSTGPDVYTSVPLSMWGIDIKSDALDVTNFDSGGWAEVIANIFEAEISASGPYNGVQVVTQGTAARFKLTITSGLYVTVDALVTNVKVGTDVKGFAKIDYSAKSTGTHSFSL